MWMHELGIESCSEQGLPPMDSLSWLSHTMYNAVRPPRPWKMSQKQFGVQHMSEPPTESLVPWYVFAGLLFAGVAAASYLLKQKIAPKGNVAQTAAPSQASERDHLDEVPPKISNYRLLLAIRVNTEEDVERVRSMARKWNEGLVTSMHVEAYWYGLENDVPADVRALVDAGDPAQRGEYDIVMIDISIRVPMPGMNASYRSERLSALSRLDSSVISSARCSDRLPIQKLKGMKEWR